MSRIVYVNGSYVPEEQAKVSVFDRAFLFGDGVYEVTAVLGGRLVDGFAQQLGGQVERQSDARGTTVHLILPAP